MKMELLDSEILHLTALLKDYPANSFFADTAAELADCGYLRKSRSGLTYRLTEKGESFVTHRHDKDKFPLGIGKMLNRRIECGKTVLTMYRAGIDVFGGDGAIRFFPAFMLRRIGDMTLGASQLIGLLITETKTYLTYFADRSLKIDMEIAAAKRILPLAGAPDALSVIIICDRYKDAFYAETLDFPLDVHAVSCDDTGAKQLRFMCVKDGREKCLTKIFNYNDRHHNDDCKVCDGLRNGVPYLFAYDMDLRRITDLFNYALNNKRKVTFSVLQSAGECFPKKDIVEVNYINENFLWETFDLKPELWPHA